VTTETYAAFARRLGVSKAAVSQWKAAGRLVLVDGRVDVEASQARLAQTKGGRDDVADRLADERAARNGDALDAEDVKSERARALLERARNEARIKAAQADKLEMERDALAGDLIAKSDVDYVLDDFGATLRQILDGRAERIGAMLGLTSSQIVELAESDERILGEMAHKLEERAKLARKAEASA